MAHDWDSALTEMMASDPDALFEVTFGGEVEYTIILPRFEIIVISWHRLGAIQDAWREYKRHIPYVPSHEAQEAARWQINQTRLLQAHHENPLYLNQREHEQ